MQKSITMHVAISIDCQFQFTACDTLAEDTLLCTPLERYITCDNCTTVCLLVTSELWPCLSSTACELLRDLQSGSSVST